MKHLHEYLRWDFPLPRVHTGIELGNGVLGLSVWGDECLHLTIGRTGFWDHRGTTSFARSITYSQIRELLGAGREAEVQAHAKTGSDAVENGSPRRPSQIGGGRLELRFPRELRPIGAEMAASGVLTVRLTAPDGEEAQLAIRVAVTEDAQLQPEVAWIEVPPSLRGQIEVRLRASWEWVGEELTRVGIAPPTSWSEASAGGFHQALPADPGLAIAWLDRGSELVIATALGAEPGAQVRELIETADIAVLSAASRGWWERYWSQVPSLSLPDETLMRLWYYGLVKQAGLTTPHGVAATLQGPWMEENRLPPWSNDYHFNINLQMIYWPCLSSNRTEHLQPLWDMVRGWLPDLRALGQEFFGVPDAIMLPHAVDDRGCTVDTFWHGTIDHACPSWIALLAWLHYRYSGETDVLRDVAWPLLTGSFGGYWAMAEETTQADGTRRMTLPVSVSPEYGEGQVGFWGANASFQLAAAHMVAGILPQAAAVLGEPLDPRWAQLDVALPPYAAINVPLNQWDTPGRPPKFRIGIWDGQDLAFSHRHQSHLAGIYPFGTIDPFDPTHSEIVDFTLGHWQGLGSGGWCSWAMPWVSTLCARAGRGDAALVWLRWLVENSENKGHNLSPGGIRGAFNSWGGWHEARTRPDHEIMQIDANLGIVTALHELCVQCFGDEIRVLPSLPYRLPNFSFERIGTEGGFLVGATVKEHKIKEIRIQSTLGGRLRLRHGLGAGWQLDRQTHDEDVLITETQPCQSLVLHARSA